MSGTKKRTKPTKPSTKSVSKKPKPSSKTLTPSAPRTQTGQKSRAKSSLDTQAKAGSSLLSSMKKTKKKTLESSQQESLQEPTKNPWAGYDYENMPALNPEQAKTFKRISKSDFSLLSRGRPRKSADKKFQSITMRIEPALLILVKEEANYEGIPWQSYLKILVKKGLDKHI